MQRIGITIIICLIALTVSGTGYCRGIDLAVIYPPVAPNATDQSPGEAYTWEFTAQDMYSLKKFHLKIGKELKIRTGKAALGIGHCEKGAVWAVVIPDTPGTLESNTGNGTETVEHVWLRFHPSEISRLFPSRRVSRLTDDSRMHDVLRIAQFKIFSSFHSGARAFIPPENRLTVDVRTTVPVRRLFDVNTSDKTARYLDVFAGHTVSVPRPMTPEDAEDSFEILWTAYDQEYAGFCIRPEINWNSMKEQFLPQILSCGDTYRFALKCAEMLAKLRDRHSWIQLDRMQIPVYTPEVHLNANRNAAALPALQTSESSVRWGITDNQIGYIALDSWKSDTQADDVDIILEKMRNTRGLIIDVRLNGGGSEPVARLVAGRFLRNPAVYAYSSYRNGESHLNMSDLQPRIAEPRGPWQYARPVAVLIGGVCLSSNESFIAMMSECPQVQTIGERTGGSSGNPTFKELPCGVRVSIPQWMDYLPDKTPLELKGIQPDIHVQYVPEDYAGTQDAALEKALAILAANPLPEQPIQGPEIKIADRPRVIETYPADQAVVDTTNMDLRIRFDRPMDPDMAHLMFRTGGYQITGNPSYDPDRYEFTFPVNVSQGTCEISTGGPSRGFCDVDGTGAEAFHWSFQVSTPGSDPVSPKITAIQPASGSQVPRIVDITVQFDTPMNPNSLVAAGTGDGNPMNQPYTICPPIDYNPDSRTFTVTLVLKENWSGTVVLKGFQSTDGHSSPPVEIQCSTSDTMFSETRMNAFNTITSDPKLLELFQDLKSKRMESPDFEEAVQKISQIGASPEGYRILSSNSAGYKWSRSGNFIADIHKVTDSDLYMSGFSGTHYWYLNESGRTDSLAVASPREDSYEVSVAIDDPFWLLNLSVEDALKDQKIEYLGKRDFRGRNCHVFRRWSLVDRGRSPMGSLVQQELIFIDMDSGRMVLILKGLNLGISARLIYSFHPVENGIPPSVFDPATYTSREMTESFPMNGEVDMEDITGKYIHIDDSSGGNMRVRFGVIDVEGRHIGASFAEVN